MARGKKQHPRSIAKGRGTHDPGDGGGRPRTRYVGDPNRGPLDNESGDLHADEENVVNTPESRKYARKKLESNWDRYDEPDVDEHAVVMDTTYDETKDFEYIRSNSACASSHFKFREEKEWENDLRANETSTRGGGGSGGNNLGLNLMELAVDLKRGCMETRLGLSQFLPEECRYCVENVDDVTMTSLHLNGDKTNGNGSEQHNDETKTLENILWSYNGIELYTALVSGIATKENVAAPFSKLKIQDGASLSTDVTVDNGASVVNGSPVNGNVKSPHAKTDIDDELLDDLLMNKSPDSSTNGHTSKPTIEEDKNDIMLYRTNPVSSGEKNDQPGVVETAITTTVETAVSKYTDEVELDLDMLLEGDDGPSLVTDSSMRGKTVEEVDDDLDQWLDEMLT